MNLLHSRLGEVAIEEAVNYTIKNPEKNIGRLVGWTRKLCVRDRDKRMLDRIEKYLGEPDSKWNKYIIRLLEEVHPITTRKMAVNFLFNAYVSGLHSRRNSERAFGCSIPWAIVLSPVDETDNLELEVMDRVISEGKQLGIYFYIFSGLQPLARKADILRLCGKHDDCIFLVFSVGCYIDCEFAAAVRQLGNLATAVSLDSSEESAAEAEKAMEVLGEYRCLYGYSVSYDSSSMEGLLCQEYRNMLASKGCRFGLYFNSMQGSCEAVDRASMFDRISEARGKGPIPVFDFHSDHRHLNGCIGGGRKYFHINAKGDCEPCMYVHYSDTCIKEYTIIEALRAGLFKNYRKHQPFSKNPLKGCPLLDKPDKLMAIVSECKAHCTCLKQEAIVTDSLQEYDKY